MENLTEQRRKFGSQRQVSTLPTAFEIAKEMPTFTAPTTILSYVLINNEAKGTFPLGYDICPVILLPAERFCYPVCGIIYGHPKRNHET